MSEITRENLLKDLALQVQEVVTTLLKLRKPETAYETVRAIDSAREVLHWVADAEGLNPFFKDNATKGKETK
jgi:hypothetical protein